MITLVLGIALAWLALGLAAGPLVGRILGGDG